MSINEIQPIIEPLTARELQILRRLSRGMSNREIAKDLVLSQGTIKWYNKQIYQKLGVNSRTKAVARGRNEGLFEANLKIKPIPESFPEHNLPAQVTSFVGRKNDLNELAALLRDPTVRLVNILGPGGIGKTRLAIEAAHAQRRAFDDGVYFVALAAFDDPDLIAMPIANAINYSFIFLGQSEKGGEYHLNQQLLDHMHDRQMLLLLDNLEHLLEGLPIITDILQFAGEVKILATSRERLNLKAETVFTLGSMLMPAKTSKESQLNNENQDALQLFVNSAKRVQPRFELKPENMQDILTICQLVDGLPLGIELAAAWAGLLTPGEIAAEIISSPDFLKTNLSDVPDRQRSIRRVFESSWSRLFEIEKAVFQQLSVFRGGFTHQAAKSLTGATLQILMALVNKSLIQPDNSGRYHIHELLRQFGRDRLQGAGETVRTKDQHLIFFLKLAEEAEPKLQGAEQVLWLNKMMVEHDNLRAALDWSLSAGGEVESGLLIAGALEKFWSLRGYFDEGRRYLEAALSRPEASDRTAARAKALNAAGVLAYMQSDYPATKDLLEESMSIYRELGSSDQKGHADALITLGDMESELGNYNRASSLMAEALEIMRELEDINGTARALWQLGQCAVRHGSYDQAVVHFNMALPLLRQTEERSHTAITLSGLAEVAIRRGDYERAFELEKESMALRREINETWGIAISLANFGWMALKQDKLPKARDLFGESLELRREIGDIGGLAWCLEKLAEISIVTAEREAATSSEEGFRRAAKLFGAAEGLRTPINSAIDLVDQPRYERQVTIVREQFDKVTFSELWDEGKAFTLAQAIEYALAA